MKTKVQELFSSRFGLIATTLGMAIGAGNIWRFPRLAGKYGGPFLLTWAIFLVLWSIPLLLVEFSMGKKLRLGVIAAFGKALGGRFTFMGWFVAFCTSAIMFYYAVVSGWSLKYLIMAFSGDMFRVNHDQYWAAYTASVWQPVIFHLVALSVAASLIYAGVVKGIERFSKWIIPSLFVLLIVSAVKAISLNGADIGLSYLFSFKLAQLADYKVWLEGLSQSAWSTGAGWGLLLTYAIYTNRDENITGNVFMTGIGNNLASIFAGLAIIPTVFALSATVKDAQISLADGNQGLAFITVPKLFSHMSGGKIFALVFFTALFFAALSSLISMLELATRLLMDFGLSRKKSTLIIACVTALFGLPSAISMDFFSNQDWVWGLGLMVSGAMFTFVVVKIGVREFVDEWYRPKKYYSFTLITFRVLFYFVLPMEFVAMLGWWLYQSTLWLPDTSWDIFEKYSLATTFFQWGIVLFVGLVLNNKFNDWLGIKRRL